jgi:hypothetical protein
MNNNFWMILTTSINGIAIGLFFRFVIPLNPPDFLLACMIEIFIFMTIRHALIVAISEG